MNHLFLVEDIIAACCIGDAICYKFITELWPQTYGVI